MIAIIDYDAGNIKSVEKALQKLGQEVCITRDPKLLLNAEKVILPGVGAFGDAMSHLNAYGLVEIIREIVDKKTPFLGICLGLQLLFERSAGRGRSGNFRRRDSADSGPGRAEDSSYGLELSDPAA